MSFRLFLYTMRRAFWSFRDSPFTTFVTIATIAISLFIFNGFLLLEKNVTILLTGLGERIQVIVYLKDNLEQQSIEAVLDRVRSHPAVKSSRYISKNQAWLAFQDGLGNRRKVLEGLDEKILPASIEVTLKDAARTPEGIRRLSHEWRALPEIDEIQNGEEWVERLGFLLDGISLMKLGLGTLLFLATLLIVSNTIKLSIFARKDEIGIMILVGATTGFVRAPFLAEGVIHGALGASLAVGALGGVYASVRDQFPPSLSFLFNPDQVQFLDPLVIGLIIGLGVLLGGCGSVFACGKFLRD